MPDADTQKYLLLVDDEEAFGQTLALRLDLAGVPCRAVTRGEDALALLAHHELEVILLDLNMPGLSGLDTLTQVKASRPDVEVIVLTGESDLAVAARAMRRGANDYLLKPVDFPALLAAVDKARSRARAHRERLRALQAGKLLALGALAEGVGHELNNPLQIIMQRSELLLELAEDAVNGQPDFAQISASAESIRKQARRCGTITAQLLELAGKARCGEARTDLAALLERIFDRLRERATGLGVRLQADLEPNLPLVNASPAEMEPLLAHLLRNALDAVEFGQNKPEDSNNEEIKEKCLLRVEAMEKNGMVRIVVADNGAGISPEHAPRIFEPFFSTRPVGRGVGLGLTVCHSIVADLRGSLRHMPNSPCGTVFTVEIPQ